MGEWLAIHEQAVAAGLSQAGEGDRNMPETAAEFDAGLLPVIHSHDERIGFYQSAAGGARFEEIAGGFALHGPPGVGVAG